jgi:hypothetical protein
VPLFKSNHFKILATAAGTDELELHRLWGTGSSVALCARAANPTPISAKEMEPLRNWVLPIKYILCGRRKKEE